MKRCWLHVGMHKTGTTSVQACMIKLRKVAGWKYLAMGGNPNMGALLFTMFASRPERSHWYQKRGDSRARIAAKRADLRRKLREGILKHPKENLILSGESLSLIDPAGVADLKAFLDPLFDEIRVIGYVRAPLAFKVSFFQQRLKHSDCGFDFTGIRPDYRKRFAKFDEIFGRENVILRKFEPDSFTDQCVVYDFCEQIGMPVPDVSVERVNESLSREACGILYAYRKYGPGYGRGVDAIKENKRIVESLVAMNGTPFRVAPSVLLPGLLEERPDIQWMEERLGESLDETCERHETDVEDEESLLKVDAGSCRDFADRFGDAHGLRIPSDKVPDGDPADPREIAAMVGHCRLCCRRWLRDARKSKKYAPGQLKGEKKRRRFHSFRRFFEKRLPWLRRSRD